MNGVTWLILIGVVVVIGIVVASFFVVRRQQIKQPGLSGGTSRAQTTQYSYPLSTTQYASYSQPTPEALSPPLVPKRRTGSTAAANDEIFVVKGRREGTRQTSQPLPPVAVPADWGTSITLPPSIKVVMNQKDCIVCGGPIRPGYSRKGWARCMKTLKLVHGDCYAGWKEGRSDTNPCPVCGGNCASGRPLEIVGLTQ